MYRAFHPPLSIMKVCHLLTMALKLESLKSRRLNLSPSPLSRLTLIVKSGVSQHENRSSVMKWRGEPKIALRDARAGRRNRTNAKVGDLHFEVESHLQLAPVRAH